MMAQTAAAPTTRPSLDYPRAWPWILFGIMLVFGVLGGLLCWGALASLSGAVIGQGVVSVESNVKTIQHLDGGIVADIRVRNGDRVREGDVLIRLDETTARANLGVIMARLNELYATRARLDAENRGDATVARPAEMAATTETDSRMDQLMAAQTLLFAARQTQRTGEKSLLLQQIEQLGDQINGLSSEHLSKEKQSELIAKEIAAVRPLLQKGLYTQSRFLALEREAARLEGEVGKLVGDIARVRGAVTETKLKITQIDKDFIQGVLTDLREAQSKIAELEEQRVATVDRLTRVEIRAPRAGIVHNVSVHTIGGVVTPANPILEIIPEDDNLIIETRLAPSDVDQIKPGQITQVRFAAFDRQATPALDGRVKKVSAAQLTDRASGTQYFTAVIEIAPSEIARLGPNRLVPGMPAEVFIETSSRTPLSYVTKPLTDALTHAFRER